MRARASGNLRRDHHREHCRGYHGLEWLEPRHMFSVGTFDFASLASFTGRTGTGSQPQGLVMAPNGDLYGVTAVGGAKAYGSIFKIAAGTNTAVTLVTFTGTDGAAPRGNLVLDGQGNLFGTTVAGGTKGKGTIFELPAGATTITTLASFTGANGATPFAGLVADSSGNLWGTTTGLPDTSSNKATVFKIDGNTHAFSVQAILPANSRPAGTLVFDGAGNIYGTTTRGGATSQGGIFKIGAGTSTVTILASFNGTNGAAPDGTLILDAQGNIFGTAANGGPGNAGTIFELPASSSTITRLASFNTSNGNRPIGNLIMNSAGDLYGVTSLGGGHAGGAVYALAAGSHIITLVHAFSKQTEGLSPTGALVMDPDGDLIGATYNGGTLNLGSLFELLPTGAAQKPVKLVMARGPSNIAAGQAVTPSIVVQIQDVFGHVVTSDNDNVTLTLASGPTTSTLTGTVTVAAVNGVATFSNVSVDKTNTYTLTATDGVRTSVPSAKFTVSPDVATAHLLFVQPPTDAAHGAKIAPTVVVKIVDNFGNVVTGNSSKVTMAISSGPGGAVLSGTLSFVAAQGTATFADLSLNLAGLYQLSASAAGLTPVVSDPFTIS